MSLISVLLITCLCTSCSKEDSLNGLDTTPPTVWMTYPSNGDAIPVSQKEITVVFHERMNRSTITTASFVVQGLTGSVSANTLEFT